MLLGRQGGSGRGAGDHVYICSSQMNIGACTTLQCAKHCRRDNIKMKLFITIKLWLNNRKEAAFG